MVGNILFFGGIAVAIIGGIGIIKIDGSMVRAIICGAMILIGVGCGIFGYDQRTNKPIEYTITEVVETNTTGTAFRVTLTAGSNSTIVYTDDIGVEKFKDKSTITLTKREIEALSKNN